MLTREDLAASRTIDFTTYGRNTGRPHRIEIWWFHVTGRFIITGTPGPRDWLANVRQNPEVVIHLDGHDIAATASEVHDPAVRRHVFSQEETRWYTTQAGLDRLVEASPMIEVSLPDTLGRPT